MNTTSQARQNPLKQFWDKLDDRHTVMLGGVEGNPHLQPMTANGAREENAVWFFSRRDTDLARAVVSAQQAMMCVTDHEHGYYACVSGTLVADHSEPHIERYWNAVAGAWYPEGRSDPELTMLKFVPSSAAVWAGPGSRLKFGWEIARSNITGSTPDVGVHTTVTFP